MKKRVLACRGGRRAAAVAAQRVDLAPELGDALDDPLEPGVATQRPRVTHRVRELHRVQEAVVLGAQLVQTGHWFYGRPRGGCDPMCR
jgi:hypothetical protein